MMQFSACIPYLVDPTAQNEELDVLNLLSKFQLNPTVNEGDIAELPKLLYEERKLEPFSVLPNFAALPFFC